MKNAQVSVMIVDDDRNLCKVLTGVMEDEGLDAFAVYDVDSAVLAIEEQGPDIVISDLKMPGKSGMDLLEFIKQRSPETPVIMITAHGTIEASVTAMKNGAYDFITKPLDDVELLNVVKKALSESQKNEELISAYFDPSGKSSFEVIGASPAMQAIFRDIRKIAPTDSTVLISGETGVGKELIAKTVHLSSPRRDLPFIKVNCAAIPEGLLESELFGYEKGAFTGAATSKPGRFEIADRGTLFLDEIGETPLHLQAKLLGVLQDRAFERVGGVKTINVDIRVIAATNRELQAEVKAGRFREDLFYRLNVVPIRVLPLRERKDDLLPLVNYFLGNFSDKYHKKPVRVSPEVISAFGRHSWPGNIRELENVLERMIVLSDETVLALEHVPAEIRGDEPPLKAEGLKGKIDDLSRSAEKQIIMDALEKTKHNRSHAARLLGISRRTLQKKIKEYGI